MWDVFRFSLFQGTNQFSIRVVAATGGSDGRDGLLAEYWLHAVHMLDMWSHLIRFDVESIDRSRKPSWTCLDAESFCSSGARVELERRAGPLATVLVHLY